MGSKSSRGKTFPCLDCGRMTRHALDNITEFPGTRKRGRSVWCDACARNHTNATRPIHPRGERHVTTEQTIARTRMELAGFIAARRARGVSPEGILMDGEEAKVADRRSFYRFRLDVDAPENVVV